MGETVRRHWPEYLMEAGELGIFMISAGGFTCLLFHPASPLGPWLPGDLGRRFLMGLAMGATAFGLFRSGWGRRSGAHINPAVTLAFWKLGKIGGTDALFYAIAQFAGGIAGMWLLGLTLRGPLSDAAVEWAVTRPGHRGAMVAFAAELAISFALMLAVLVLSNTPRLARHTALAASALVAFYITFESPLSGMSMNPARSFASAASAGRWPSFWIYLTAPPLAMLAAAVTYVRAAGAARVHCAKVHHDDVSRCIFRCGFPMLAQEASGRHP